MRTFFERTLSKPVVREHRPRILARSGRNTDLLGKEY
jgi:hypothetical protein